MGRLGRHRQGSRRRRRRQRRHAQLKLGDQPAKFSNFNSGYLGVGLEKGEGGAKVNSVQPKSPAEIAGIKLNDVIFEAAGRKTSDPDALIRTVASFKPGDKVLFKLKRGDDEMEITATLGTAPKELKGNPQETMGTKLSSRRGGFPTILQHDSGVRPEHCGGPLVDLDGKTIGINIARAGRTETYAIPSEDIQPLLSDLKSGKLAPPAVEVAEGPKKGDFTVEYILKADDKVVSLSAGNKDKHYSKTVEVQLSAGATYVIEMNTKEKKLDPYLILQDGKGKELAARRRRRQLPQRQTRLQSARGRRLSHYLHNVQPERDRRLHSQRAPANGWG